MVMCLMGHLRMIMLVEAGSKLPDQTKLVSCQWLALLKAAT
jgi:hypothetical protein